MTGLTALELPNGARFYRCALQVNPYAYLVRHSKQTNFLDEATYNEALITACTQNGIEAIGVTDHYRINDSRSLIAAARKAGLLVFPGFEAVTKDGVHFLCLFEPSTKATTIERRIGLCGVADDSPSPLGHFDSHELLREAAAWPAVCIAAHVASQGGLLKTLSGQSCASVWRSEHLHACAIPGRVSATPANIRPILENKNAQYRREHPIAVLNAQDVSDPAELGKPGASTFIKMSAPSLDGLREAFLDPESRIRLGSDPEPGDHIQLVAVEWNGGFLDGCGIHFNPNLNVLIGGRGTGKSSVVESVRAALDSPITGEEARRNHQALVKEVLRPGTKISLVFRSPTPVSREYTIERTVPNAPVVRDESGEILDLRPLDVTRGIEIYGQHEISEMARSPQERTRLLERFITAEDAGWPERRRDWIRRLEVSRKRLQDLGVAQAEAEERIRRLPALEEELKRYEQAGLEATLEEKSDLVTEEQLLRRAHQQLVIVREALEDVQRASELDIAFLAKEENEGLPNRDLLAKSQTALRRLQRSLKASTKAMASEIAAAEARLGELEQAWAERAKAVEEAYEKTLRELQRDNVDGSEFIRLRQQIEALKPVKQSLRLVRRDLKSAHTERAELIKNWDEAKAENFRALQRAARRVNRRLKGRVRVSVTFQGNRDPLTQIIRQAADGRLSEALEAIGRDTTLSPAEFVRLCRSGVDALVERLAIPESQAKKLSEITEEGLLAIEEILLPATTDLELNVTAGGQPEVWQQLARLSAGQKATAVLLLLLLESSAPLIIDQPEDDLDNRFITDSVVPRLRQEKQNRQFVFTTHNANIPVLGDAEFIAGLAPTGEPEVGAAKIPDEHRGSIDMESIRDLVGEVLEGGKDAFELRRLKYGY
jgi:hypothetical protein